MGQVEGALGVGVGRVEVERQQLAGRTAGPRLGEEPRGRGGVIVETTYALVRPEVMVEGPVLVHQEDDVLDRTEIGPRRRHMSGFARRLPSAGRQSHAERAGHARDEHFPPCPQVRSRHNR